jgi:hypothetical protein
MACAGSDHPVNGGSRCGAEVLELPRVDGWQSACTGQLPTTPTGAIMQRTTLLTALGLVFVAFTQSGCLTLLTATACAAGKSSSCGGAIAAAATTDAVIADVVLEASAQASAEAHRADMEACWNDALNRGDDPEVACGYD